MNPDVVSLQSFVLETTHFSANTQMQAIVNIAGAQYRVSEGDTIVVPHLTDNVDTALTLNDVVLTINDKGEITVGSGSVKAKVMEHGRASTVLVFHKKRRKSYQKMNGHRQPYTKLQITGISA